MVYARGIPYATAQRFGAPQDVADWTEPRDALERGPACPQNPSRLAFLNGLVAEQLEQTEDCLVLSVTAPENARNLPVMVWFHGGAYQSGGGEAPKYEPHALVSEGNVVVVNVTHRLGIFGYLAPDPDAVANAGLRDQIAALRWVQRNIAAFGGDTGNVTVFGQSAGGDSVLCLLVADDTAGLFHRAIMQSAPLGLRFGRHPLAGVAAPVKAAIFDALNGTDPRAASVADLLRAQRCGASAATGFGPGRGSPYAPTPGAAPLPPANEWRDRLANAAMRVDLVVTYTRDDAAAFLAMRACPRRLYALGAPARFLLLGISKLATPLMFGRYSIRILRAAWKVHRDRMRVYRIDWSPPGAPLGAAHCIELPLLLGAPNSWSDAPMLGRAASSVDHDERGRRARRVWTDIARYGVGSHTPHKMRF
jgi:para-nitrobenzyl esterase